MSDNETYYNTALYNKVLEAMDKGQIVVFKYGYGYNIAQNTAWGNSSYISIKISPISTMNIYPENGATNLYTPANLTPYNEVLN
jgi:hypothetical protein